MLQVECIAVGPEPWNNVAVVERDLPSPGPGQIRVAVHARPINPADLLLLEGRHVYRPALPAVVGIEGAGIVIEIGAGVALPVGTAVAIPTGGTWREHMIARETDVVPLPAGTDLVQASMVPVNGFTAAGLLDGIARGSWIIQNAATSAVARIITRLATRRGIRSISVVRSPARNNELRALGADHVVVDGPELTARVREPVQGGPIVRALDAVAGDSTGRLYSCVAEGGELITYGLLASNNVVLPAAELVFRDVVVRGFSRVRSFAAMPFERRRTIENELVQLLCEGALTSEVEACYPLADVVEALRHHCRPDRRGKILLVTASAPR